MHRGKDDASEVLVVETVASHTDDLTSIDGLVRLLCLIRYHHHRQHYLAFYSWLVEADR